jgi:hypothetical protein
VRQGCADEHGKIAQGLALVAEYAEAIEADLQRFYNVDLLDMYRPDGKLSLRKVVVLVNHLPPESTTMTAIRNSVTPEIAALAGEGTNPAEAPWSQVEMLLAAAVDELRGFRYMYISAHVEKGQAGKPPDPIVRPGLDGKTKRKTLTNEQRMMLDPRMRKPQAVPDLPEGGDDA